MRTAYHVDKVRAAERALMAGLPEGTLMRRAAVGLAATCVGLLDRVYGSRVVLLVGSGDNGGDALYAGARLAGRGAQVRAVLAGSRVHQTGLAAFAAAGGHPVPYGAGDSSVDAAIDTADLIIDGMVGIGGSGELRHPYADLAERANLAPGLVVAVDVPSGVDASTGCVDGAAVRADVTVTFGAYKAGLLINPGATHAGVVRLVDIGLNSQLAEPDLTALQSDDVAALLPRPTGESDKYRRGVVGVIAGSDRFTGAAVLAVGGAVRAGAGMVRFVSTGEPVRVVRQHWPEAVTTVIQPGDAGAALAAGRVQAWVVGPGFGVDEAALAVLAGVMGSDVPVLVDADGLTLAARHPELLRRRAATVLTPHAGELARLLGVDRGDVEARRLEHVRRAANELGCVVLLKGLTTLVATQGRPVRVNATGTPWLATGGTGDVLAGLVGTLLASGLDPYDAASAGAYLHGLAGRRAAGGAPIAAGDVAEALPAAFHALAYRLNCQTG